MNSQDWHRFYMSIAKQYAALSKSPTLKVGCIMVPNDFSKIISVGYNGWEKGGTNEPDSLEEGKSGAIHGEINCMLKVDNRLLYSKCYMYITHSPCKICSRAIVNFGTIVSVIYNENYRDLSGIEILKKSGISCIKI